MPPLRDRSTDIPMIAEHYADLYFRKYNKEPKPFSRSAMEAITTYHWPGNIRALRHAVERAVILSKGPALEITQVLGNIPTAEALHKSPRTLIEKEEQFLREALEECEWRIQGQNGAAAKLDVSPSTLRSRMKRLGIARP